MEFLTTKQVSLQWGISSRRIALLCAQERIPGAVKAGKTWILPADAKKCLIIENLGMRCTHEAA